MSKTQKNEKQRAPESWKHVVDRVIDFISSSKSALRILNEKDAITDEKKAEAAKQNAKEVIRRKLIKEFINGGKKDVTLTELHVNQMYKERTDSNVRCSAIYTEGEEKLKDSTKKHPTSLSFLDEQYNLTKQAIARRYRPQMKICSATSKNNAMRDFLNGPYTQELHRITNVASEQIQLKQSKKKHIKKSEKSNPPPPAEISSNKETHVIYEKY